MLFRTTERMRQKIGAGTLDAALLADNVYADWPARLFTADRTQFILLSHTASLYSVVMYGRGITSASQFLSYALKDNISI